MNNVNLPTAGPGLSGTAPEVPYTDDPRPYLYSPMDYRGEVVRYKCAGVATAVGARPEFAGSISIVEMKSPGSLVLPKFCGDQISRDEATEQGALRAIDCAAGIIASRSLAGLATADEDALFDRAAAEAADDHEARELARYGGEFPRGEFAF